MPNGHSKLAKLRSDQRIPRLRTRGRANRQKLLDAAEGLVESCGGQPMRFSEVFAAAGVSRGSAYRIYDGMDDLMQDLASFWIRSFIAYVNGAERIRQPGSWMQLSDHLVAEAAAYWIETAAALRALPRGRSNISGSYRAALKDLTKAVADTFERYFFMPKSSDWSSALGMYTSLGDTMFADALHCEGRISERRLAETQKICRTYLSFYLPTELRAKFEARGDSS